MTIVEFLLGPHRRGREVGHRGGTAHALPGRQGRMYLADLDGHQIDLTDAGRSLAGGAWLNHVGKWQPGRVLAECQAKRAIIERVRSEDDGTAPPQSLIVGDDVLKSLAAVYADHPEYREEWRA